MIGRGLHLPSFLVALALAVGLKVGIHESEQLRERLFEATVNYDLPDQVTLVEFVEKVKVRLRGKAKEISEVSPFAVEVLVELGDKDLGAIVVPLERQNVLTPGDFEVVSIDPNRLSIEVEPLVDSRVPIQVRVIGEPAAGSLVDQKVPSPTHATVRGPASRVGALESLITAPVSLDGHAITFEETVSLVSPDPLIQILEPNRVQATIVLLEPELSSTFDGLREEDSEGAAGGFP